jgi:hypothetical protein
MMCYYLKFISRAKGLKRRRDNFTIYLEWMAYSFTRPTADISIALCYRISSPPQQWCVYVGRVGETSALVCLLTGRWRRYDMCWNLPTDTINYTVMFERHNDAVYVHRKRNICFVHSGIRFDALNNSRYVGHFFSLCCYTTHACLCKV